MNPETNLNQDSKQNDPVTPTTTVEPPINNTVSNEVTANTLAPKPKNNSKKVLITIIATLLFGTAAGLYLYLSKTDQPINKEANNVKSTQEVKEVKLVTAERLVFDEKEITKIKNTTTNEGYDRSYNTIDHKIYAVDLKGNKKLLYSFTEDEENSDNSPYTYLIDNNEVMITNPEPGKNSISFDKDGKNITSETNANSSNYGSIPLGNDQIAYYKGNPKDATKKIYIENTKTNTEYSIDIITSTYEFDTMGSLNVAGLSKDSNNILYVNFLEYEFAQYSRLWRVNTTTKEVTAINSVNNLSASSLFIYPKLDLAIGIEGESFNTPGASNDIDAPTKLILIDIKNDTKKEIAKSDSVIKNVHLSEDGNRILYQESESAKDYLTNTDEDTTDKLPKILSAKILDLKTNQTQDLSINKYIYYCSKDFKTFLLGQNQEYYKDNGGTNLFSLETNKTIIETKGGTYFPQDSKIGDKLTEYVGYFN